MLTNKTKSSVVGLALALTSLVSHAQDLNLKKDVITKDKVPYAKASGKAGLLKGANLTVSSLNGDSLINITTWNYPSGNPMFDYLSGYKIRFIGSGKEVIKSSGVGLTKDQLINFILIGKDYASPKWEVMFKQDLIVNNAVDPAAEAAFIAKFDNTANVEWAKEYEAKEKEILNSKYPVKRDTSKPLKFKSINTESNASSSMETIRIYQGDVVIGLVEKYSVTEPTGVKYTYTFYNPLNEPFAVGEKKIDKVIIATAKVSATWPRIFINATGKRQDIEVANPANAENQLADMLVMNGSM